MTSSPHPGNLATKLRWRIWSLLSAAPGICPANAHSLIISGYRRSPAIDSMCRENLAGNGGSCWCGKVRLPDSDSDSQEG